MTPISASQLLSQLRWRYATKKFDPQRRISPADWQTLEDAVILSPSSFGLQPWRFFVIDDPKLRGKLRELSWNQPQITDASHLVVFAVKHNPGQADVERHIDRISSVRGVPREKLDGLRQMMLGTMNRPGGDLDNWLSRQVYIALGVFLTSAALLGIDACPMEGFDAAKYDDLLGLPAKGYSARVVAAAGYRAVDDPAAQAPKVRFEPHTVVEHV